MSFSWGIFSIRFLKSIIYNENTAKKLQPGYDTDDPNSLAPYMEDVCQYPNEKFVRKYRSEIEDYFLANSNQLVHLCKRLENMNYHDIKISSNEEMLFEIKKLRLTSTIVDCYIRELRMFGCKQIEDETSLFSVPKIIDLSQAQVSDVQLFPYQKEAVNAMQKYYLAENKKAGVLVLPTGSGKTRTSAYFLLKYIISAGYQVIWLTHRSLLIEQTAQNFYKLSPLITEENDKKHDFKMVCISGQHATVRALQKDDDLIVSSVQSLCNNTIYLPNIMSEKVMIVVDEAHHTLAPSYRRIINLINQKNPEAKLLGLTATPVRLTDNATKQLMKLFDNKVVYSKSMSSLIAEGYLATPVYLPRVTNIDIESIMDIDERKFIEKWGEMPETLLEKVAKTNERNEIIVNEYVNNKEKYGKTIIFALNGIHCLSLWDEFKSRGIKCDYVYSVNSGNEEKINKFKNGELDVLININMLTEGSDIPDIQSVFLTRPTSSDTLLMQMVGRGMRGIACGGTEKVNIVDFCDKWTSITRWLNPQFLFDDRVVIEDKETVKKESDISMVPYDMIRDIMKGITYKGAVSYNKDTVLPVGWYDVIDEDGNDTKVLVFENQIAAYLKFRKNTKRYIENGDLTGRDVAIQYFNGFCVMPLENELDYIISFLRAEGGFPILQHFNIRSKIDAYIIAKQLNEEQLPLGKVLERVNLIYSDNKSIIDSIYGDVEYYKRRIVDYMMYPNGVVPIGTRLVEVEKNFLNINKEEYYNINALLDEVIQEQKDKLAKDFIRPDIQWTDKCYSSYFGVYYHDYCLIRINSILNSKDIPKEVIKYIIYHECLHQEIMEHSPAFRQKERLYPNFQEHEHFLDYTLGDFYLEYAI